MTDISPIIAEIAQLPHFSILKCKGCAAEIRVHALEVYANCPECGVQQKCRSFGAMGTEIQDVIDAVLLWAGGGASFDAVMKRRQEILDDVEKT